MAIPQEFLNSFLRDKPAPESTDALIEFALWQERQRIVSELQQAEFSALTFVEIKRRFDAYYNLASDAYMKARGASWKELTHYNKWIVALLCIPVLGWLALAILFKVSPYPEPNKVKRSASIDSTEGGAAYNIKSIFKVQEQLDSGVLENCIKALNQCTNSESIKEQARLAHEVNKLYNANKSTFDPDQLYAYLLATNLSAAPDFVIKLVDPQSKNHRQSMIDNNAVLMAIETHEAAPKKKSTVKVRQSFFARVSKTSFSRGFSLKALRSYTLRRRKRKPNDQSSKISKNKNTLLKAVSNDMSVLLKNMDRLVAAAKKITDTIPILDGNCAQFVKALDGFSECLAEIGDINTHGEGLLALFKYVGQALHQQCLRANNQVPVVSKSQAEALSCALNYMSNIFDEKLRESEDSPEIIAFKLHLKGLYTSAFYAVEFFTSTPDDTRLTPDKSCFLDTDPGGISLRSAVEDIKSGFIGEAVESIQSVQNLFN